MSTNAQRLAAARLALAQAEQKAGLTVLWPQFGGWRQASATREVRSEETADPVPACAEGEPAGGPAGAADGWEYLVPVEKRQVVAVSGSTSLFLHVLARLQGGQGWCAVVGHPALGWCAAQEAGVNLEAVLAVPQVGERAIRVLTALAEGMDVLAIGPQVSLSGREQRFLTGKVRERGGAIVAVGAWEGAWRLEANSLMRRFLGRGEGCVDGGSWTVYAPKRPTLGETQFTVGGGAVTWEGGGRGVGTGVGVRVGT